MSDLPENIDQNLEKKALQFINSLIDIPFSSKNPSESIKQWRQKNQLQIIIKTIEILNQSQIQPQKLEPKSIIKFLEYASFENNTFMQLKWAALLANACNPFNKTISLSVFSELLNQLSLHEVKIFEQIFNESFQNSSEEKALIPIKSLAKQLNISIEYFQILSDNLSRLKLIEILASLKLEANLKDPYFGALNENSKKEISITLTELGLIFVQQINI